MKRAISALLAFVVALACAGCGGGSPTREEAIERYGTELRQAVSDRVDEPARRTQMLRVVDRVNALEARFSRETAEFIDAFRRLNADYDTARPAFDRLFADYESRRIKAREEALDLHYELASLATAGEWNAIGKAEAELYEESHQARPATETAK